MNLISKNSKLLSRCMVLLLIVGMLGLFACSAAALNESASSSVSSDVAAPSIGTVDGAETPTVGTTVEGSAGSGEIGYTEPSSGATVDSEGNVGSGVAGSAGDAEVGSAAVPGASEGSTTGSAGDAEISPIAPNTEQVPVMGESTEEESVMQESTEEEYSSRFTGSVLSLLPPLIAIVLALITKEVYSSLFVGILSGGILYAIGQNGFQPIRIVDAPVVDGIISAISGSAGIFAFLVFLGIIVAMLNKAGGSRAFGEWASKHVKSKVGAMLATFVFGVLIFIDDYFNCLTVGAVMRPVTDKAGVSRSKLAYLIDATAAPICMIAPISSWAAAVASYAPDGQGISLFIRAIPYNLYSLMTFVFIIALTLMKFDYGPMKLHERNAAKGDLFTSGKHEGETEETELGSSKGKVIDLVLPILILIVVCVFALFYVGRSMGEEWVFNSSNYDASMSFIDAFSNTDATVGLPWGGLVALIIIAVYFIARRLLTFKEAMDCIPKGFNAMVPAILILTLATALKNTTGLLDSTGFVEGVLANASQLAAFLPAIIFLVACFISFSTGTSWGTFGILIPIVLAIFPVGDTMGIISMSACLAGSVCGDHCSPISDTSIMSSAGAQCNHINHISTQLPYAITVAAISFVGYIIAGFVQNAFVVLGISILLTIGTLFVIRTITQKKA